MENTKKLEVNNNILTADLAIALGTIHELRDQLAERDAQLAAERAMADTLAEALKQSHEFIVDCTVGDWEYEANGTDWPDSLVNRNSEELVAYNATRQPTQDKGDE